MCRWIIIISIFFVIKSIKPQNLKFQQQSQLELAECIENYIRDTLDFDNGTIHVVISLSNRVAEAYHGRFITIREMGQEIYTLIRGFLNGRGSILLPTFTVQALTNCSDDDDESCSCSSCISTCNSSSSSRGPVAVPDFNVEPPKSADPLDFALVEWSKSLENRTLTQE